MSDTAVVRLDDVNICQKELLVLEKVNFVVNKGDFVYLIGKTGSGKSSLLKTLYAELPLQSGTGTIVGVDLGSLKQSKVPYLRRRLGVVFQDFQLLTDRTIHDNLAFVLKATGWKKADILPRILEVLEYVEMEEHLNKYTHELSGGEQQRIVIARALLNKPEVILADEPTGNLDPETSDALMQLLRGITATGTTVIMATHNYSIIDNYDGRVFRCEDRALVESTFRK
jgi:cell division transport system ATP-binding protein